MAKYVTLALTVVAAAAITARRGVTDTGAVPAAGARVLGFSQTDMPAGHSLAVDVTGVTEAETGAAIAAGAELQVDALGRVVTLAGGTKVGRMAPMQAAAAGAGEVVEILRTSAD